MIPEMPEVKSNGPEFLNDGKCEVEVVDTKIAPGRPAMPIPSFVFDLKVTKSDNTFNPVGELRTIRVGCKGYSWGKTIQTLIGAMAKVPRESIDSQAAEALVKSGRLKGRKIAVEQETRSNDKGAVWREYKAASLDGNPIV